MARTKQTDRELAEIIGKTIRAQRDTSGLTQAQLAEAIGLENETISRMENGKRLPTLEKLVEMAGVFKIPVASFFEQLDKSQRHQSADLFAQKISLLLSDAPDSGRRFLLKVAQDYAKYHVKDIVNK